MSIIFINLISRFYSSGYIWIVSFSESVILYFSVDDLLLELLKLPSNILIFFLNAVTIILFAFQLEFKLLYFLVLELFLVDKLSNLLIPFF